MAANGHFNGSANGSILPPHINSLNDRLKKAKYMAAFHEDESITDARKSTGLFDRLGRIGNDLTRAFAVKNWSAICRATSKAITLQGPDVRLLKDSSWTGKLMML